VSYVAKRNGKHTFHPTNYIIVIDSFARIVIHYVLNYHIISINQYDASSMQERKQYEAGCKFTWNIDTSQYRITDVLPMEEVKPESWKPTITNIPNFRSQLWNPTRRLATQLREKIQQPYAHTVRFLHNEMNLAGQYLSRSLSNF